MVFLIPTITWLASHIMTLRQWRASFSLSFYPICTPIGSGLVEIEPFIYFIFGIIFGTHRELNPVQLAPNLRVGAVGSLKFVSTFTSLGRLRGFCDGFSTSVDPLWFVRKPFQGWYVSVLLLTDSFILLLISVNQRTKIPSH